MGNNMKRRHFLANCAALGVAPALRASTGVVPALAVVGSAGQRTEERLEVAKAEILQVTGKNKRKVLYLKIHADRGLAGLYGPIDNEAAIILDEFFRRQLIGQDPLAYEAYWD